MRKRKLLLKIACYCLFIFAYTFSVGQSWDSVGCSGLWGECGGFSTQPNCMAVYQGDLYTGGSIYTAGTLYAPGSVVINCIGRWNGTTWDSVKAGIPTCYGGPYAMMVYKGNLYAGGLFSIVDGITCNNIAKWNDTVWSTVGGSAGANGGIYAMAIYNGNLYVGGYFDSIGNIQANSIAMWNGTSWSAVGNGITQEGFVGSSAVYALCVYNNKLYAAGQFDHAGNIVTGDIAAWDGTNWSALSSGVDTNFAYYGNGFTFHLAYSLAVYNGDLYVGGFFDTAGNIPVNNIATWDGTSWAKVGSGLTGLQQPGQQGVDAMLVFNNTLYVGGNFDTAGGIAVSNIATWNGTNWGYSSGVSGGIDDPPFVTSFAVYNSSLFATGNFDTAGGAYTWDIAMQKGIAGINNLTSQLGSINVYPNPGNGMFTMQLSAVSGQSSVEVYNMLGEKVYSKSNIQNPTFNIDISSQPNGVYLYKVLTENGSLEGMGKLMIER